MPTNRESTWVCSPKQSEDLFPGCLDQAIRLGSIFLAKEDEETIRMNFLGSFRIVIEFDVGLEPERMNLESGFQSLEHDRESLVIVTQLLCCLESIHDPKSPWDTCCDACVSFSARHSRREYDSSSFCHAMSLDADSSCLMA